MFGPDDERTPTVSHRAQPSLRSRVWDFARFVTSSRAVERFSEKAAQVVAGAVMTFLISTATVHCSKQGVKDEVRKEMSPEIAQQAHAQAKETVAVASAPLAHASNEHAEDIAEVRQQLAQALGAVVSMQDALKAATTPTGVPATKPARRSQRRANESAVKVLKQIRADVAASPAPATVPEKPQPEEHLPAPSVVPVSKPLPPPSVDAAQKGG